MYSRHLLLRNSGPTERCAIDLPFNAEGRPKPVLVVGGNGTGKTNFLSVVADALMELAATHFRDALPPLQAGHSFYRVSGGTTRRSGARFDLAALSFVHEDQNIYFRAQSGDVPFDELTVDLQPFGALGAGNRSKVPKLTHFRSENLAETVFRNGVYAFFPSWRSEPPHWLNDPALKHDPPYASLKQFSGVLNKALVLEQGLRELKPWIIDIILDQTVDVAHILELVQPAQRQNLSSMLHERVRFAQALWSMNAIVATILGTPDARIVRGHRVHGDRRIQIYFGNAPGLPILDSLSAGQSTLLNIFGNTFRLGTTMLMEATPAQATGIVLVDEIDAHLHADLQYEALPRLIKMFPRVQFIVTCHSPLFPLGMDKHFGADGYQIIEMPNGIPISCERYSEFLRSFEMYQATKAFEDKLKELGAGDKPLVIGEGPTDPHYLKTAAVLLGYSDLLEQVEFSWIGELDPSGKQTSGEGQVRKAFDIYRVTPSVLNRPVLCLLDQKVKAQPFTGGKLFLRILPLVSNHPHANDGPENLLPPELFGDEFYEKKTRLQGANKVETKELKKVEFARHVCEVLRDPAHFERFRPVLDEFRVLLLPPTPAPPAVAAPESVE